MTDQTTSRVPGPASTASNRSSVAARRGGYLVAAALNAAVAYGTNVWPGWTVLPFLTPDTTQVLVRVNSAVAASIMVNLIYVWFDARWLRALGDLITAALALLALAALWRVFPFGFGDSRTWPVVARAALVVGIAGSAISLVVQLVVLLRLAVVAGARRRRR